MSLIEALILGIVQGLTEFLPVSSSGHLEIGSKLFGVVGNNNLLFSIVVHGATALSTIFVFRKDIIKLIAEGVSLKINDSSHYILMLVISMIPVGVIGLLWEEKVEVFFGGNITFVGVMLIVTAILLAISRLAKGGSGNVSYFKAFIIGLSQAAAILPGISRSGATISTALLLGVEKTKAAKFSFLMVLAPIIGANLLKLIEFVKSDPVEQQLSFTVLTVGFISAFISGTFACKWMVDIVRKGNLFYFALYCLIIGLAVIFLF